MTILVSGVAGFIGSHLAEKLLTDGHTAVGVDNFDPFYPKKFKEESLRQLNNFKQFSFIQADIRDNISLNKIFKESKIDAVIHLAAKAGVRPSIEQIKEY